MVKHQNDYSDDFLKYEKLFTNAIDIIKQAFGNDAFLAYDRQNKAFMNRFSGSIYDSITIPVSMFDFHDLMVNADEIRKVINDIKLIILHINTIHMQQPVLKKSYWSYYSGL